MKLTILWYIAGTALTVAGALIMIGHHWIGLIGVAIAVPTLLIIMVQEAKDE